MNIKILNRLRIAILRSIYTMVGGLLSTIVVENLFVNNFCWVVASQKIVTLGVICFVVSFSNILKWLIEDSESGV